MPLVEQELLTLPEHLSSPPVFSTVCITRSVVLDVFLCIWRRTIIKSSSGISLDHNGRSFFHLAHNELDTNHRENSDPSKQNTEDK